MAENGAGGDHTTAYLQLQGTPTHEIFPLTVPFVYMKESSQSSRHITCKYMVIYLMRM
jgi:hypothetical protein